MLLCNSKVSGFRCSMLQSSDKVISASSFLGSPFTSQILSDTLTAIAEIECSPLNQALTYMLPHTRWAENKQSLIPK